MKWILILWVNAYGQHDVLGYFNNLQDCKNTGDSLVSTHILNYGYYNYDCKGIDTNINVLR